MSKEEWARWFAGKTFTSDWTSHNFANWSRLLAPLRGAGARILEIGSYEGRSATFFLEYLPDASITCIDLFPDSVQARFDANLAAYGARVTKLRGRSVIHLDRLRLERQQFELIYIDGSHRRDDTLIDSLLAWTVLRVGGIVIWDDYLWQRYRPAEERPEGAINVFLDMYADQMTRIHRGYQIAVRKEGPQALTAAASATSAEEA